MSLVFYLIHPRTPGIAGGQIDAGPAAVRLNGVELTQAAAVGDAAISSISFDDPAGTLDVTGLWSFRVDENTLSVGSNSALYYGFVGDRTYTRGERDSLRLGAARRINADVIDLNAYLGFRMLTESDANRLAETAAARLAWVLADSYAPFHDHGNVTYPTNAMDANDYRGRYFGDVLADIAAVSGYNYWLDVRQSDGQVSLFFGPFNTSTAYGSPLRVSNVYADVAGDASGWTYPPYIDAVGKMSPSRVASGVYVAYAGGNTFVRDQATASNFNFRDLVAPMATVHSASKAGAIAARFLEESATEDWSAIVTVRLPITKVPLVKHGMRMQGKFSHFDAPYNDWTWYRITRSTLIQDEDTDETVRLRLELSPQGEAAVSTCNTPGSWAVSYGYGGTVSASNCGHTGAVNLSAYTDGTSDDLTRSSYGATVFSAAVHYRGWIVDLGAEYEVSALTHVGRVTGIDDATFASTYLSFRGGTDLGSMSTLTGTITGADMNGWTQVIDEPEAVGYTIDLNTPTVVRYVEVRDTWTSGSLEYRGTFWGYQLLVAGCEV